MSVMQTIENRRLSITSEDSQVVSPAKDSKVENGLPEEGEAGEPVSKWGFPQREAFRLAVRFYKEKEGKAVHVSYQDKLRLVAFWQQATRGKCGGGGGAAESLPELGVLDVVGRDRRLAWQGLGDLPRPEAMSSFVELLESLCPLFGTYLEAHRRDLEEKKEKARQEEQRRREDEELRRLQEEMRVRQMEEEARKEARKRQVQDALNQQTYAQFKAYAHQQYPGNPEQQAVLIRQLQEQHYHQYMQQLYQQQLMQQMTSEEGKDRGTPTGMHNGSGGLGVSEGSEEEPVEGDEEEEEVCQEEILEASMWTRKDIREFKDAIRQEGGDAIIKVGHGETVTVRVPTHEDGTCLFWEFATDNYDIGFGVYFEWTKSPTSQVSVHISESEEEEEEEEDDGEDDGSGEAGVLNLGSPLDVERGAGGGNRRASARPPTSVVVPIYRRDCHEEVYCGSHVYPGEGIYLLKFDNSYSLWRSKTLFYRVYYTR